MTPAPDDKYASLADLASKLHPDEPWFVVRAQDVIAPQAVAAYAGYLRTIGLDEQADQVEGLGIKFLRWQAENRALVKRPD